MRSGLYGSLLGLGLIYSGIIVAGMVLAFPNWYFLPLAGGGLVLALIMAEVLARRIERQVGAPHQAEATEESSRFARVVGELQRIIGSVTESSSMLDQAATESSKTTESIAYTIGTVAEGASQQADIVRSVLSNVEDVQRAIFQVSDHSKDVTHSSAQVFTQAESGKQAVEAMVGEIRNIAKIIKEANATIDSLAERSEAINEITNTIKTIAEQTNLLALNAAIEAARAGDQGRGFAVVADEVRKLAEGSAQSVDQINQIIRSTISDTSTAQKAMIGASLAVQTGVEVASMAADSLAEIVRATQDSRQRIEDINAYIKGLHDNAQAMIQGVEKIAQVADSTAHKSQDVAAATEEQTASVEEMSANAAKLNQMAAVLHHLVNDLKTREVDEA